MAFAPIALFAFRRPDHLRRTIEALKACPEFSQSPLFVYCDGPRNDADRPSVTAARNVARAMLDGFNATMIESAENRGLAKSIIAGVGELCEKYGRAIVVEDDLLVSPDFLAYMNAALDRYAGNDRVFQVSGYMFPIDHPRSDNALFLPLTTSWGWATWSRAWKKFDHAGHGIEALRKDRSLRRRFDLNGAYPYYAMLRDQQAGKVDSWAIRWYLSVFLSEGLVLFPAASQVRNVGFDGSGRNCGEMGAVVFSDLGRESFYGKQVGLPDDVAIDEAVLAQVTSHLRAARRRAVMASVSRRFSQALPAFLRNSGVSRQPGARA